MIEEVTVECPYCGECFTTLIDDSAGAQYYTEDCHVCCQPIAIRVAVGFNGELTSVSTAREND